MSQGGKKEDPIWRRTERKFEVVKGNPRAAAMHEAQRAAGPIVAGGARALGRVSSLPNFYTIRAC